MPTSPPEPTPPTPPEGSAEHKPGRYSQAAAKEAAANPKEPFAYQAAKISLAAPFIAIALALASLFLTTTMDPETQRTVRLGLGALVDALLLAGVVLGIAALLAVRRLGGKGLVVRSVIGVLVSGLLLGIVGYSIYQGINGPAQRLRAIASHVVGNWESTLPADGKTVRVFLTLNRDGTADWKITGDPGMDAPAKWTLGLQKSDGRVLLALKFEPPLEKPQHIEGVHWILDSVSDSELSLINSKDDGTTVAQTYVRAH